MNTSTDGWSPDDTAPADAGQGPPRPVAPSRLNDALGWVLVFLLPVVVVVGFCIAGAYRPPVWRVPFDRYRAAQAERAYGPAPVVESVPASRPWAFAPELSHATFSDTLYYATTYDYAGTPRSTSGLRPLPFPLQQVQCIVLEQPATTAPGQPGAIFYRVIFVALHQDLYNAD